MITLNLGADFDFWHRTFERTKGKGKSKRGKVAYAQRLTHGMAYLWDWVADQAHKHGAYPPPGGMGGGVRWSVVFRCRAGTRAMAVLSFSRLRPVQSTSGGCTSAGRRSATTPGRTGRAVVGAPPPPDGAAAGAVLRGCA